jgi:hypothetical protein
MEFPSKRFLLAVTALMLAFPSLAGCSTEQDPVPPQIQAINSLRSALDLPQKTLEYIETTTDANSPDGNLQVAVYRDADGRRYCVDTLSNKVVEVDARALLDTLAPLTPSLSEEAIRGKALRFMRAAMPGFDSLQAGWTYEEGGKVDNFFFTWVDQGASGTSNPTRAQLGIHKSGLLFAYYNTLILEK